MSRIRHSVELFRAYRHEATDPETFYGLQADETVSDVARLQAVEGLGIGSFVSTAARW